mmetsp:Transcript_5742/g.13938  ORF Transcript_5742/g.13938 Transcript_5742/m.13938 type:complete len:208 (+) Transcript_5742:121-744(+)
MRQLEPSPSTHRRRRIPPAQSGCPSGSQGTPRGASHPESGSSQLASASHATLCRRTSGDRTTSPATAARPRPSAGARNGTGAARRRHFHCSCSRTPSRRCSRRGRMSSRDSGAPAAVRPTSPPGLARWGWTSSSSSSATAATTPRAGLPPQAASRPSSAWHGTSAAPRMRSRACPTSAAGPRWRPASRPCTRRGRSQRPGQQRWPRC